MESFFCLYKSTYQVKVSPVLPGPEVFISFTIAERVTVGLVCMIVENTVENIVIDAYKLE